MCAALVVVVLAAFGAAAAVSWHRSRCLANLVEALPTTPLRDLRDGLARIEARIKPTGPLLTTPTGRPCVYYSVQVSHPLRRKGRRYSRVRTRILVHEVARSPFVLDDGSGEAELDLSKAELILELDRRLSRLPRTSRERETYAALVARKNLVLPESEAIDVYEFVLEPGDSLHVVGAASRAGDRPLLTKGDGPFIVTDRGAAGVTEKLRGRVHEARLLALGLLAVACMLGCVLRLPSRQGPRRTDRAPAAGAR